MTQEEKITLQTDDGEAVNFYVLEETRINGMNYLMVMCILQIQHLLVWFIMKLLK